MVGRALRWGWLWVAVYALGGCLCLAVATLVRLEASVDLLIPAYALASFAACGLLAYFGGARSQRESALAAFAMGALPLLFDLVNGAGSADVFAYQRALGHPLHSAGVCLAGGALGGRLGAQLSARRIASLGHVGRALFAAVLLIGVFYVHALVLAFLDRVVPGRTEVLLLLLALALSPACAGAALRFLFHRQAESAMVGGLLSIGVALSAAMLLRGYGLGLVCLSGLVLLLLGATVYTLALPGLVAVTVREGSDDLVAAPLPKAVALHAGDSPNKTQ